MYPERDRYPLDVRAEAISLTKAAQPGSAMSGRLTQNPPDGARRGSPGGARRQVVRAWYPAGRKPAAITDSWFDHLKIAQVFLRAE
jgi:hypothetical protein